MESLNVAFQRSARQSLRVTNVFRTHQISDLEIFKAFDVEMAEKLNN